MLPALPRVPMLAQLWERDEEFPARASFLFDTTAGDHLVVDAILALSAIVAKRLVEHGNGFDGITGSTVFRLTALSYGSRTIGSTG